MQETRNKMSSTLEQMEHSGLEPLPYYKQSE